MQSYLAPRSGQTWPLDVPRWCGDAREALMLTERRGIGRAEIATGTRSIWRYAAALPFLPAAPISMGEGCTPLVERRLAGGAALLKCEWFMPTGSFKDRGASVMLSLLRDQGIASVLAARRSAPMRRLAGWRRRSSSPPAPAPPRRCNPAPRALRSS
jgi:threonine synthase